MPVPIELASALTTHLVAVMAPSHILAALVAGAHQLDRRLASLRKLLVVPMHAPPDLEESHRFAAELLLVLMTREVHGLPVVVLVMGRDVLVYVQLCAGSDHKQS